MRVLDGMKRGESVVGVVLDYDVMKNLVYVSLKEDLVESREVQYKQVSYSDILCS